MKKEIVGEAIRSYQTPFYIYDTDTAAGRVRMLRDALGASICYAMKANPFLVGELAAATDYFEVCSPGEFRICERCGIAPEKIVLSGVSKRKEDLLPVLERYGSRMTYTVESLSQWELLAGWAREKDVPLRVLLRLTVGNQFGMDRDLIRSIVAHRDAEKPMCIEGIQFFSGTQKKSAARMIAELEELDDFLSELERESEFVPARLEYGPGLPVRYFDGEEDRESELLAALSDQLDRLRFRGRVVLELGRSIAADCGVYVTSVSDVKTNAGSRFCIVDGGIHQLNYFGQMMAMKRPPVLHWESRLSEEPAEWTVCGSLCTMNDVLLKAYPFRGLRTGDHLVFQKTGAYSAMESMSLFLSRDLPAVLLASSANGLREVRSALPTDALNSAPAAAVSEPEPQAAAADAEVRPVEQKVRG